jgi:hypothetical protein
MKFKIAVPATVRMVIEIEANTLAEAQELWNEGEFNIVSEKIWDADFDDVNLNDVISD